MKRVIVTGAAGFVGVYLTKSLVNSGYEVYAIVRQSSDVSQIADLNGVHIIVCDQSHFLNIPQKIEERGFAAFFHLAWSGSAGPERLNYRMQLDNVQYTCDAVKAAQALQCKKFLMAATIAQYELLEAVSRPQPLSGGTIYSTCKTAANYMARTLANSLGIEYTAMIISNIYGPGERSPRLINATIRKLLRGEETVFSTGTQMYDFIYVVDAVNAMIALLEKGKNNIQYYIGSLTPRPLREYLQILGEYIAPDVVLGFGKLESTVAELDYSKIDIYALKRDTGFVPYTTFSEGIQATIAWIRSEEAN